MLFWLPYMDRQRERLMRLAQEEIVDDPEALQGLLTCLRTNWDPRALFKAFPFEAAVQVGGTGEGSEWVTKVIPTGQLDRSYSIFFGHVVGSDRNGLAMALYSSGNTFLGSYEMNEMHGPAYFSWKCGMKYSGNVRKNLRCGSQCRLELADGAVFEGEFSYKQEKECEPQEGIWTIKGKQTKGWVSRCFAEWHALPDEAAVYPFLFCKVGDAFFHVTEEAGKLEPCPEDYRVPSDRYYLAYRINPKYTNAKET
jgi:hypothetical protein